MQSKFLILIFLITFTTSFDMCGDGSICFDTMHCCKATGESYTCCLNDYQCCSQGDYCCRSKHNYEKIFKMKSIPSYKIELPEIITLLDAALYQLDFYEFFPYLTSCGKETYPLLPSILEIIEQIKNVKKVEDLIPIVVKIVNEVVPKVYDLISQKCKNVPTEVEEMVKKIYDIVTADDFLDKLVNNAKNRFQEIFIQINSFQQQLEYGNYKQAGKNIGTAIAIALMID